MPAKQQLKYLALRCTPAYHAWVAGLVDTPLARKLGLKTPSDVMAHALTLFARKAGAGEPPERANPPGVHLRRKEDQ